MTAPQQCSHNLRLRLTCRCGRRHGSNPLVTPARLRALLVLAFGLALEALLAWLAQNAAGTAIGSFGVLCIAVGAFALGGTQRKGTP